MEIKKKHSKAPRKCILMIMTVIFLTVFSVTGALCVYKFFNEQKTENRYQQLQKEITVTDVGFINSTGVNKGSIIPFEVDLASLQKQNPDTAGWLYIPSLEISYPLMYSGDNDYYLHRDFNREYHSLSDDQMQKVQEYESLLADYNALYEKQDDEWKTIDDKLQDIRKELPEGLAGAEDKLQELKAQDKTLWKEQKLIERILENEDEHIPE